MSDFKNISSRNELADYLKIERSYLAYILYVKKTDNLYTSFEISKKNGGFRQINSPEKSLMNIQKRLADAIWMHQLYVWKIKNVRPNISHAFEKKKSIITNAAVHKNKRFILNIDLENYFDSFHFGRVRGFFAGNSDFKLPVDVATVIAQIACYNGRLPQGSPSSPIITNLIGQILDRRLLRIAKEYKMDYTRYADDLTFSTNRNNFTTYYSLLVQELTKEIMNTGFEVNNNKTRLQYKDSRQVVTGLTVNKKVNVNKNFYKTTRAMAFSLYKNGVFHINGTEGNKHQLEGRFAFIDQLVRYNKEQHHDQSNEGKKPFYKLNGKEEQYRRFLFYSYFFANDKPIIITEGKTDVAYLKAALRKLYASYPRLISKSKGSGFNFKVTFLKRTDRLAHLFGFFQDGADAMKNIYNYYTGTGKNGLPNYLEYFTKLSSSKPKCPVILLFDNELISNKPLKTFSNYIKKQCANIGDLPQELGINIMSNLFLHTNPLVKGMGECELEDLFDDKTLAHTIGGKRFSREDDYEKSRFYGKYLFSKYISSKYKNIDFTNFIPLLNKINDTVENYDYT
jgi:RNA-directed DNA polymerase